MRTAWIVLLALPLVAQQPPAEPAKPAETTPEQTPAQAPAPDAPTAPAAESWITGDVDLGFRWIVNRGGDLNTYRSTVDLGQGPKLFGVNLTLYPPNGRWADRIDIRANSWGGDPYNTARIEARKQGLYRFTWDYRNIAYFNFLPSFADPSRETTGAFLNQRSFDSFLRTSDFEFTLFPGKRIIPYAAYSRGSNRGTGLTNVALDFNEYTFPTRLDSHSDVVRAGVRFEMERYHATLEQGFLSFADDQNVTGAFSPANPGNLRSPFLGQRLFLTSGLQSYQVSGGGVFTKALFTANPVPWADLYAQFLYSQPHADVRFDRSATGNVADLSTLAFFNMLTTTANARARQPHPSGSAAVELRPFRRLRIMESWTTNRLHDAGSAILNQLLTTGQAATASQLAEAERLVVNYNQQELNLLFDVTSRITLRGGHRYVWGDAEVPAAFILGGEGGEAGKLRRNVALAGAVYRSPRKLRVSFEYEGSPGDRSYFRTSLNEYQKGRLQASYQALPSLSLNAHFGLLGNRNPQAGVDYHFLSRDNGFAVNWLPSGGKRLDVLAEYTRTSLRSTVDFRNPGTGLNGVSDYHERAHLATLTAGVPLPLRGGARPRLDLGGSFYISDGTSPMRYYQPFGRLIAPFTKRADGYAEWRWYALTQSDFLFEGFRSHQFVLGLRLKM